MKIQNESYNNKIERLYWVKAQGLSNQIIAPNITFQVTDDCNLKCSYCYQKNKGHHIMSFDTAKKFIDLLLDNDNNTQQYIDTKNSKAVIFDFIGGEPLLQITLIDKIIEYFWTQTILKNHPWQYNWRVSISSNGTLYFNPEVQKFLQKYQEHLSFSISIDGNKELHDTCRKFPDGSGSYDIAMAAVRHYREHYGATMGSKMTLSPENIQYTADAVINLINEKYTDINLNCVFEKGWNYNHATILYNELKKLSNYLLDNDLEDKIYISMYAENFFRPLDPSETSNWCGGNGRMLAIDYKGDIYPCLRYMESSLGADIEPIIIGNVDDGIMTNAKCRNCANALKQVNRITQSTQECIECPIAAGCAWCQAYNYQDSGNFNHRATYICCMHKARALGNIYFWNRYYKKHGVVPGRFPNYLPKEEALKIISEEEYNNL